MEKRLVLIMDLVEGTTTWENPDEMTNFDAMGLIEMVKAQIIAQMIEDNT